MKYEPNEKFSEIRLTHLKRIKAFFQSLRESEAVMRISILLLSFITTLIIISSCDNSPTGPEEPPPGRRDYVWEVDTIIVPFTFFNKIWGDAPDNVWMVGPGGSLKTTTWHYDGTNWSTDNFLGGISPKGVWGFGKDDVWIAGNEGRIWHYNGINWSESLWYSKENFRIGFEEIWGDQPDNIYATGYADSADTRRGMIFHWDGIEWAEESIPAYPTYDFIKIRKGNADKNNNIMGWGEKSNGGDILALFEFDGESISKIYEADFIGETWVNFEEMGGTLYYVIGNQICSYKDGQFRPFIEVDGSKFNQGIWGRNKNDIIISMTDGIAHYNGTDVQYIYHYKGNEHALGAVTLNDEIFILTNDYRNNYTVIIRGELP